MPKWKVSLLTVHIYLLSANGNNFLSGNNNRGCCFHLHTMASLQSETCALQQFSQQNNAMITNSSKITVTEHLEVLFPTNFHYATQQNTIMHEQLLFMHLVTQKNTTLFTCKIFRRCGLHSFFYQLLDTWHKLSSCLPVTVYSQLQFISIVIRSFANSWPHSFLHCKRPQHQAFSSHQLGQLASKAHEQLAVLHECLIQEKC